MFFITSKASKTGNKFSKISKLRKDCFEAQKVFSKKYGFGSWRQAMWSVFGGMSSCCDFKSKPDSRLWKVVEGNEYFPKKNCKEAKVIYDEIKALPKVSINELNECIGFVDGFPFKTIGFAENNDEYFGFQVKSEWNVEIPEDCKEVTETEYNKLFKINQ